jgi:hypothetical protein
MMTRWHPATKLLVLLAAVAIPYLLWTSSDGASPAVAQAGRTGETSATAVAAAAAASAEVAAEAAAVAAERRVLPPLQTFAAAVERPLFTPTRRLVRPVEAPPPDEPAPEEEPEVAEAGPPEIGRPELRFFGTIRQRGRVTALVTREGEPAMEQLAVGDEVEGWQVEEVTRNRLVLARDGREEAYAIFAGQEAQ